MTSTAGDRSRVYRVVQWATGRVGTRSLQRIIEHPNLELVGLYVHSPEKIGRDAGDLAGLAPVGIKAVNSLDEILALKPDCVLYMPHVFDADQVCRILASGANIVSTRMELQNPRRLDPALADRLEEACRQGNSSVHATGSSPGFITEALPFLVTSLQRRMDSFAIREFADCSNILSAEMLFGSMGFGQTIEEALARSEAQGGSAHDDQHLTSFGPSLHLVADALGLEIEGFETQTAVGLAREDVVLDVGTVRAGTVAATRITLAGMRGGKPLISFTSTWFVTTNVDTSDGQEWEMRSPAGWHVMAQGDTPVQMWIDYPIAAELFADMTPNLTAHRPINAVPYVCDAPAGIRTTADLPLIIARMA